MALPRLACGDCGAPMGLGETSEGRVAWLCTAPGCDGYHGAHPDGQPMGSPADRRTRYARAKAHAAFDPLWRFGLLPSRDDAYTWLSKHLLRRPGVHIADLSYAQALYVARAADAFARRAARESSPLIALGLDPWGLAGEGRDPDGPLEQDEPPGTANVDAFAVELPEDLCG